jgi:ATP-binding cassette subfamily B protein
VIEAGRIVESGTHAVLIEQDGLYAELAAQQLAASRILEAEESDEPADHPDRRADRPPAEPRPAPAAVPAPLAPWVPTPEVPGT